MGWRSNASLGHLVAQCGFRGSDGLGNRYLTEDVVPSRINSPDSTNLLNSVIACSYPIPSNTRHCLLVIKPFCITNLITFCLISSLTSIVVDFILTFPFVSLTSTARSHSETSWLKSRQPTMSDREFDLTFFQPRFICLPLQCGCCSNPPSWGSLNFCSGDQFQFPSINSLRTTSSVCRAVRLRHGQALSMRSGSSKKLRAKVKWKPSGQSPWLGKGCTAAQKFQSGMS